jgi:hypothetical protein
MSESKILIACSIFADELRAVLPDGEIEEVIWLDTGLHAEPDKLEKQICLAGKAAMAKADNGAHPRLLLGCGCHPEIDKLAQSFGARPPAFKNCIEAFAGERRIALEADRTMLITPGWVRDWPGRSSSSLGWDATEMRIQHGRYDRILLLDPGINPVSDEEIMELFDLIRVPIEKEPLDLSHFQQTLSDILD